MGKEGWDQRTSIIRSVNVKSYFKQSRTPTRSYAIALSISMHLLVRVFSQSDWALEPVRLCGF